MSTYLFDQAWRQEHDRLHALEALFDDASAHHLARLGVGPGWRCLEVGAGAGGVARWLADRVGPSGQVLATDLDPRFLDGHGRANLQVRQHDILTDPLPDTLFDLAHARAVLEHTPHREQALARMVCRAPRWWVVVEDVDFGEAMASALARYLHPHGHGSGYQRLMRSFEALFAAIGADASFGTQLPQALLDAGLEQIARSMPPQPRRRPGLLQPLHPPGLPRADPGRPCHPSRRRPLPPTHHPAVAWLCAHGHGHRLGPTPNRMSHRE